MIDRDTQTTHPVAPVRQSLMGPGAQPLARAKGPRTP